MNVTDIIFQAASSMTGGLISDISSVVIAMVGLMFICMGFDYVKEAFDVKMHERGAARREADEYQKYSDKRDQRKRFADSYSSRNDFVGASPSSSKKYSDGVYT